MKDATVLDYVAEKIMADLRSGADVPSAVIDEAVRYELTNHLRSRVWAKDFDLARGLCESGQCNEQRLGLSLIQGLRHTGGDNLRADIYSYLTSLWEAELEFESRASLVYALLDYEELLAEFHEKLLLFTEKNWDRMIAHTLDWCGGPAAILRMTEERVNNPKFPRTKRWIYLCLAVGADDLGAARALVEAYAHDEDLFLRRVVSIILARIDSDLVTGGRGETSAVPRKPHF
jgi:hypothetical protein